MYEKHCVACGAFIIDSNHKCSTVFEARIEGAQTRANNNENFLAHNETPRRSKESRLFSGLRILEREDS